MTAAPGPPGDTRVGTEAGFERLLCGIGYAFPSLGPTCDGRRKSAEGTCGGRRLSGAGAAGRAAAEVVVAAGDGFQVGLGQLTGFDLRRARHAQVVLAGCLAVLPHPDLGLQVRLAADLADDV